MSFHVGDIVHPHDDLRARFVIAAIVMRDEPVAVLCRVTFLGGMGDWAGDWLLADLTRQ